MALCIGEIQNKWGLSKAVEGNNIFLSQVFLSKVPRVYYEPKNESHMSQWGVIMGRLALLTQECSLSYRPSPKTNKVSDTDEAPACAPAPAFVQATGHNASCDQEAASLITHWDTSAATSFRQLIYSHAHVI